MRAQAQHNLRNRPGEPLPVDRDHYFDGDLFAEYVGWRERNPSDDLITELLNIEFEDGSGTVRRLSKEEILIFLAVIAGAGVETTGRLFGWMGKVLAEHPDQRKEVADGPHADPEHDRGAAALRAARAARGPLRRRRRRVPRSDGARRERLAADAGVGQPGRAPARGPGPLRHPSEGRPHHLRVRHPLLPRSGAGPPRGPHRPRRGAEPVPRVGGRPRQARRAPTSTVRGWDSMPAIIA